MQNQQEAQGFVGKDAHSNSGGSIGKIGLTFLDHQTDRPKLIKVNTGLFETGESFALVADATTTGDGVTVPFTKDNVKDASQRITIRPGAPSSGGIIAVVGAWVVTLSGAILGGLVGLCFHRKVGKAGLGH